MKKIVLLLSLGIFLTVSCTRNEQESLVSSVSFTTCNQTKATKNDLLFSDRVDVEFINGSVKITHYSFEVTCDFTEVDVTYSFAHGVLSITQQSSPSQADCICHSDVSYTINGISQDDINVIFINGKQVYCHNDEQNPSDGRDVYVVIYEFPDGGGWAEAKLWKNGVSQPIHGINYVTSVYVADNDVYVAGFVPWYATLWKNGETQSLSSYQSSAYSVFVSDNDVYVVGSEYRISNVGILQKTGFSNFERNLNIRYQLSRNTAASYSKSSSDETQYMSIAKLWKNGIGQDLSDGPYETIASSVYVSNGDVYVVGRENININQGRSLAKLWKNGEAENLSDGNFEAEASSVFVSDGNVYVAFCEKNAQGIYVAKLWKNGAIHNLTDGNRDGFACSVYVSGNDVYVAGFERNHLGSTIAKLWKNGIAQNLIEDGINIVSEAQSVYVLDGDVYVVGYVWSAQSNFHYVAKLWKNGVVQNLTDGIIFGRYT